MIISIELHPGAPRLGGKTRLFWTQFSVVCWSQTERLFLVVHFATASGRVIGLSQLHTYKINRYVPVLKFSLLRSESGGVPKVLQHFSKRVLCHYFIQLLSTFQKQFWTLVEDYLNYVHRLLWWTFYPHSKNRVTPTYIRLNFVSPFFGKFTILFKYFFH